MYSVEPPQVMDGETTIYLERLNGNAVKSPFAIVLIPVGVASTVDKWRDDHPDNIQAKTPVA